MEESISLKSIEDFKKEGINFYIPSYQRGYRWKTKQVSQLIEDIDSFIPTEKNPFYFLQALAVAKDSTKQNVLNVVDGQQRLTTINLILGDKDDIKIDYAREANQALDQYFKESAKYVIKEKLGDIGDNRREKFCEKLKSCCRFLYYEIPQEKELPTFDELNSGKIPAKDSELVKCVMLTLGKDESIALTNSRSNEWDEMERRLNDEAFFAFITPRNTWREEDRMTILLRYAGMAPSKTEIEEEVFPFLSKIQEKLKKESRETVWKTICTAYYRLIEWYNDPIMYHALGAVVHKRDNEKDAIISIVGDNSILNTIKAMNYSPNEKEDAYHGWGEALFNYLLLSNVAFCWKRWPNRYDFQKHRQVEVWSMEHIFARNQKDLDEDELKDWLGKDYTEEKFKQYKEECEKDKGDEWLAKKLGDQYPTEEDHSIENLALLPQNANSALNNKLFEGKRSSICQWTHDSWVNYWVPPVTEAAFLKSLVGLKMRRPFWSQEDKSAYVDAQKENIKSFIENLEKIERI